MVKYDSIFSFTQIYALANFCHDEIYLQFRSFQANQCTQPNSVVGHMCLRCLHVGLQKHRFVFATLRGFFDRTMNLLIVFLISPIVLFAILRSDRCSVRRPSWGKGEIFSTSLFRS